MTPRYAAQLAMPVAGFMIAHQVAAKAVRDATFLGTWPVSALPAMVAGTAVLVVAAVPLYSALLEKWGPRAVVATGFMASALAHMLEWRWSGASPWIAVAIYLHIAGLGNLLLSGFWSLVSELLDPKAAKAAFGRIAAAGTLGGFVGGLSAARIAVTLPETSALLFLAGLHAVCGVGVAFLGRGTSSRTKPRADANAPGRVWALNVLGQTPQLKTLALIVMLGAAGAAILDYLLKVHAVERIGTPAGLLEFFATFYLVVQIATFLTQFGVTYCVRRIGLGNTISTLPAGAGGMSVLALLYPTFPMFVAARGVEAVLRGSLFRSAYELIFVPMDPADKRRTKTFLDVTCDKAGEAVGAAIVQLALITTVAYLSTQLLAAVIAMAGISLWLSNRLDAIYLGVVERRLTGHGANTPVVVGSETGWTVLDLAPVTAPLTLTSTPGIAAGPAVRAVREADPKLDRLAELRSGNRARVERALGSLTQPDAMEVAQVIQLLAWDDLVAHARKTLEGCASAHIGLLTDVLVDPDTDFAIRRRIPRVLGALSDHRALDGLLAGLDDARFEVRYQCGRSILRVLAQVPGATVGTARVLAIIERELSVSPQIWQGHRLIDKTDGETDAVAVAAVVSADREERNLEHVFSLLATVFPPEPVNVALQGLRSTDAGLRGLALEYLESVLPANIQVRLWRLLDNAATPSSGDAPARFDPPPRATPR